MQGYSVTFVKCVKISTAKMNAAVSTTSPKLTPGNESKAVPAIHFGEKLLPMPMAIKTPALLTGADRLTIAEFALHNLTLTTGAY